LPFRCAVARDADQAAIVIPALVRVFWMIVAAFSELLFWVPFACKDARKLLRALLAELLVELPE
jgi:hypothetical protein